ncbi:hypothetical protein JXB11_01685 [Candidatus Woesearchaeota archaeon]|nr:hypothetical protein [Candidatus Woesearchaeota archaeon]
MVIENEGKNIAAPITQRQKEKRFYSLMDVPKSIITQLLEEEDDDRLEELALLFEDVTGISSRGGTVFFGELQAVEGPFVVPERELLSGSKVILGYKRAKNLEEARASKESQLFYSDKWRANRKSAEKADSYAARLLFSRGRLNIPEVKKIIPKVGDHAAEILVYEGSSIADLINRSGDLSCGDLKTGKYGDFCRETVSLLMERFGYFRANPYKNVEHLIPIKYHTAKEMRALRTILPFFGITLTEKKENALVRANEYLNKAIAINDEDIRIRRDLRWENLGYALNGQVPSLEQIIGEATKDEGESVNTDRLREMWRDYDFRKATRKVPLYHDFSHIEESPLIKLESEEAEKYLVLGLLYEKMFRELNRGISDSDARRFMASIEGILTGLVDYHEMEEFGDYFSKFGINRPLLNRYRDSSSALEILTIHLPRIYIRMSPEHREYFDQEKIGMELEQNTENFWHYLRNNVKWTDESIREVGEISPPTAEEKSDLKVLTGVTEKVAERRKLHHELIKPLWDGY